MVKKKISNKKGDNPLEGKKFLPSEWARMKGLSEVLYLWYDINLGVVNEEQFYIIEV